WSNDMKLSKLRTMIGRVLLGAVLAGTLIASQAKAQDAKLPPVPTSDEYARAVLASHPIAYWRLDEAHGKIVRDATKHKHNGKYVGKPRLGEPGALTHDRDTAIGLDGPKSRSYAEIPASKKFSVATSGKGLTVEVWMRPDALKFKSENKDSRLPYIHW